MRVIIGSKNPAKIKAVKVAFQQYDAEYESINVSSGVRLQPLSNEETMLGAINRANKALEEGNGEIGIGLEGGVHEYANGLFLCNWGALAEKGREPIIAGGAQIPLPKELAKRILDGEELGPLMDEYTKKQGIRKLEGAVGVFTNGAINRVEMFSHIAKLLVGQFEFRKNFTSSY